MINDRTAKHYKLALWQAPLTLLCNLFWGLFVFMETTSTCSFFEQQMLPWYHPDVSVLLKEQHPLQSWLLQMLKLINAPLALIIPCVHQDTISVRLRLSNVTSFHFILCIKLTPRSVWMMGDFYYSVKICPAHKEVLLRSGLSGSSIYENDVSDSLKHFFKIWAWRIQALSSLNLLVPPGEKKKLCHGEYLGSQPV